MISIICSNYNSEKWIKGYLNSINNQDLSHFEIIIVDANSTDDSLRLIKKFNFRQNIDVTIIENNKRINIYEAWNIAIKKSKYNYVLNYNTDDRLNPEALDTYALLIKKYPNADIFYTSYFVSDDKDFNNIIQLRKPKRFSHRSLLKESIIGPFPLVKKKVIITLGYFKPEYSISGDYEMWLNMSVNGFAFKPLPQLNIGTYYLNPEGMSTKDDKERWDMHIKQDTKLRKIYKRSTKNHWLSNLFSLE